jgi:hypothetical protein
MDKQRKEKKIREKLLSEILSQFPSFVRESWDKIIVAYFIHLVFAIILTSTEAYVRWAFNRELFKESLHITIWLSLGIDAFMKGFRKPPS